MIALDTDAIVCVQHAAARGAVGLQFLKERLQVRSDRIEAGSEAVSTLWKECCTYGPLSGLRIVATSAVRSAANGEVYLAALTDLLVDFIKARKHK